LPDVDDPRVLRIDRHTKRLQDPIRRRQRSARLRRGRAGDNPVVRVPPEPTALASHLSIERRQKNVAQQRRSYPTLRGPSLGRQEAALAIAAYCQHRLDAAQNSAIRRTLGHKRAKFLVLDRSEEMLRVGVHDPFSACFDLLPDLAQGILCRPPSPVSEVGVIEHRLEDRFQPVQSRLLTCPILDRRHAQHPPFTRLAGLRDALLPDRFGSVPVGAEHLMQSGQALFEPFAKRFDAPPVNASRPMVGL
jgi:hypothetical protein